MTIPLLILGDAPSAQTGLGRICRDLATRIHANLSDTFEVATLGYGGFGDRSLPFQQYNIEGMQDWFIPTLRDVWENFAGDRKGILMTIWDASRLLWFSRPDNEGWCPDPKLRRWLMNPPFKRWGYFPMDATGPNNQLSVMLKECIQGYDRVLAYSKWAEGIIRRSFETPPAGLTNLPHGIDTTVFYPRKTDSSIFHSELRFNGPEIAKDEPIIGIVATNQGRKDYGLAMETLAILAKNERFRVYIQTDTLERHWSIPALLMDYGLMSRAIVNSNMPLSDDQMARIYSACDVTMGIGAGEGFGYPIFESLACGTPVLTGNYGGHAENLERSTLLPQAYRLEGLYNCVRPVYDAQKWAYRIGYLLRHGKTGGSLLPPRLDWTNLWQEWESWICQSLPREDAAPETTSSTSGMDTDAKVRRMRTIGAGEVGQVPEYAPVEDQPEILF